jgi:hypothetical protein
MKILSYILLIGLFAGGCQTISKMIQPDRFILSQDTPTPVAAYIMSPLGTVEKAAENAVLISQGGIVSLRNINLTQHFADFTVNLRSGRGLKFTLRTNAIDYPKHPSISLEYTTEGCFIKENNKILFENREIKANQYEPARIKIINDGDYIIMAVDCEVLKVFRTKLESTEFFVLESIENSEILITGIRFSYIIDEIDDNLLLKDKDLLVP